jgi:hypothetical protein
MHWKTVVNGNYKEVVDDRLGQVGVSECFFHDTMTGTERASVQQSIRDEYAQGAPTRDTARFFRLSLARRLKTSFDHQTSWLYRIQQARTRVQRDHSMNSMRATMAAFVRPQPPTIS